MGKAVLENCRGHTGAASSFVEGLHRRARVQGARGLEPGRVVGTGLEGCLLDMCEVAGKAMGGLQR